MKAKILTSILVGILVISFISVGFAIAANGNGAGLERVPVFIGFRQTPGPSEQALVRSHGGTIKYSYTLVPAIAASIPEPAIEGLRRNPNVTIVEPDIEVYAVDAELDNSWGVKHIGAGTVHNNGNKGTGIKVAIIDSGVDYTHPDLDANFNSANRGYDFVNGDSNPMDDNGHGTHCAGIVAAEDDSSGVVGVAPEADLYALKVLNRSGSGDYSDVIAALNWCVSGPDGIHGNGDDPGIKVTSNSYGSSGYPGSTVEAAFINAAAAGIINVCAAGNNGAGDDTVIYPAKWYTSCIAVAATDSSDTRASFSSTGPEVEISAPGVGIYSTYPRSRYVSMSGTSMACPHVSGTAALIIKSGISGVDAVRAKLQLTADYLGNPLWYGSGLVDADEAAGVLEGPTNQPPVANNDSSSTDEDTAVSIFVLSNDTDADNDPLAVTSLIQPSHGTATLNIFQTVVTYTPDPDYHGSDSFTYKASDGKANSNTATVTVTVSSINDKPVADAGPNQSVLVNQSVTFDGSGSYDPDGDDDIFSFEWNFGDGATGIGKQASHTYTKVGIYNVTLTVTDNGHLTDTDTITVTVTEQSTSSTMHVKDITIVVGAMGRNAQAIAYVLIMGENGPVGGAAVTAEWAFNGVSLSEISSTTDGEGVAVLYSPKVKAKSGVFTIKITNVEKSGRTYVPGDGDEASQSFP